MATLAIDLSGTKGLAPRFYGDKPFTSSKPNWRYLGVQGQLAEGIYNPISRYGYMSPANNTTKAVTGTTSFLLTSAIVVPARIAEGSTDAVYFSDEAVTGTRGQIVNLDSATDTALDQAYEIPQDGSSNYFKSEDMVVYQVDGGYKIFFTTTNTTSPTSGNSHNIGIANGNFSSPDPDWLSTVPTGASATILKGDGRLAFVLSDNGYLYVLNGNRIHRIDGTIATGGDNGTVTADVLTFFGSTGTAITQLIDAVDLRGRMWVALHVNATFSAYDTSADGKVFPMDAGVYVWDRRTTVASIQDYIPIVGVREIKSMHTFQGRPACFTISIDGYTQFRQWDGTEFKILATLGGSAYPPYRRHSVHESGRAITWFGNDGKIYFYGEAETGAGNGLYIIGDMSDKVTNGQTFSGAGVLVPLNATETVTSGNATAPLAYYLSYKDTGGNHLRKWYPHSVGTVASNTQTGNQGNVYTLVNYLPTLSTLKKIDITCLPLGASGDTTTVATLKFYANQSSTPFATKTVTRDDISKGYITYDFNKPYTTAFQMEIEWSTSATLGDNDFCPSYALLSYEATGTTKGD